MRILILHSGKGACLNAIEDELQNAQVDFELALFKKLKVVLHENGTPRVQTENRDLKDFSLIFFRSFKKYEVEASLVGAYAQHNKIPVVNSGFISHARYSKIQDLLTLANAGLPIIQTLYGGDQKDIPSSLGLPLVAKENASDRGVGVHLIHKKEELFSQPRGLHYQKYISALYDIRVLVLGTQVLGAIERRAASTTEFRHNVSLGGTAVQIPVTAELHTLALKAAAALGCEFAGVDLLQDPKTGQYYILEVNKCPEFMGFMDATGVNVPRELVNFFLRLKGNLLQ